MALSWGKGWGPGDLSLMEACPSPSHSQDKFIGKKQDCCLASSISWWLQASLGL